MTEHHIRGPASRVSSGFRSPNRSSGGGGGGSGESYDPTTIAGLLGWWKANAGTLDSGGAPCVDGVGVKTWQDQSGNGRHLTQAGGVPTFKANFIGALPALAFNGVNQQLTLNWGAVAQPCSAIVVARQNAAGGQALLDGGAAINTRLIDLTSASTAARAFAGGAGFATQAANTLIANVIAAAFNGVSSFVRVNGGQGANTDIGSGGANGINVGAKFGGGSWLNGWIMEVLLYSGLLSTANFQYLEAGLKGKWGTP